MFRFLDKNENTVYIKRKYIVSIGKLNTDGMDHDRKEKIYRKAKTIIRVKYNRVETGYGTREHSPVLVDTTVLYSSEDQDTLYNRYEKGK